MYKHSHNTQSARWQFALSQSKTSAKKGSCVSIHHHERMKEPIYMFPRMRLQCCIPFLLIFNGLTNSTALLIVHFPFSFLLWKMHFLKCFSYPLNSLVWSISSVPMFSAFPFQFQNSLAIHSRILDRFPAAPGPRCFLQNFRCAVTLVDVQIANQQASHSFFLWGRYTGSWQIFWTHILAMFAVCRFYELVNGQLCGSAGLI